MVSDQLNKKMTDYEAVTRQFSKFFSQDVLQGVLDSKVDVEAFRKESNDKVSKWELNSAIDQF
jgi:hypothetical protein